MMFSILASAALALLQAADPIDAEALLAPPPMAERAETEAQASAPAPAAAPELDAPIALEPAAPQRLRAEEIARVEAWLEGVSTLQARFRQVGADGSVLEGAFSLARPGRARFEYDEPSPVLIVADGTSVAVHDRALDTIDRAPIGSTPLRWLLRDDPDLDGSGAVAEIGRIEDDLFVTLRDPEGELDGTLTLVFTDPDPAANASSMRLRHWFAIDPAGGVTQLELRDLELGARLDPRLFVLDDAPDDRRRRGRG